MHSIITIGDEDICCSSNSVLGQLSSFNPKEIISTYLERANIFFEANKIEDEKESDFLFLNASGAKTHSSCALLFVLTSSIND